MILKDARLFVASFVKGEYTPEEYATFLKWLQDASIDELGIIADEHEALFEQWSLPNVVPSPEWIGQLEHKLDHAEEHEKLAPVRRFSAGRVIRRNVWAAAASVLLVIMGGYYLYNHSTNKKVIVSDSPVAALYSTFSVPRGGQPQSLTLADGSKIWLNASSTLKYPAAFGSRDRTVELSGEGYFEVTGSAGRPFHVKIKGAEIEVLGTHFNVKAYEEESISRTTLVDGAVKVIKGGQVLALKPGDQAEIRYASSDADATMKLLRGVNTNGAIGWRSGDFEFKDEEISNVMAAIGRSYNLDISYPSGVPHLTYNGNFSRKSNIPQILNLLESQNIHCTTEGKIIKVSVSH